MRLNLDTTKEKIFKQYLTIINPLLGKSKLSNTEVEVLSRLLLVDYMYRHLPEEERNLLIFHTRTRSNILLDIAKENPNFSKAVLHNTITTLKKKGIIQGNKRELKLVFNNAIADWKIANPKDTVFTITIALNGQDLV